MEEMERGLTTRALIFGLITLIIGLPILYALSGFARVLGDLWRFRGIAEATFMMILLNLVLIGVLKGRRFTRQELAVIYVMWAVAVPLTIMSFEGRMALLITPWPGAAAINRAYEMGLPSYVWGNITWTKVQDLYYGGPVDWSGWGPKLGFWMSYGLVQALFIIFLTTTLRRTYVDVEALPFPMAIPINMVIEYSATDEERPRLLRSKWLWLGVIVGFLWFLPVYLSYYKVSIPGLITSKTVYLGWPYAGFNFNLFPQYGALGIALLLPIDFLISYLVFWIAIWDIYLPIFVSGNFTGGWEWSTLVETRGKGDPNVAASAWWYAAEGSYYGIDPTYSMGMGVWSWIPPMLISIALWPMISHWREVVAKLKAIATPNPELEAKEAVPYRVSIIITALLGLILIGFYTAIGTSFTVAFTIFLMISFIYIGYLRTRAETSWHAGCSYCRMANASFGYAMSLAGAAAGVDIYTAGNGLLMTVPGMMVTDWFYHGLWSSTWTGGVMLEGYKIADFTGTRTRDILIAGIIGAVLACVISYPLFPIYGHMWGLRAKWTKNPLDGWGPFWWPSYPGYSGVGGTGWGDWPIDPANQMKVWGYIIFWFIFPWILYIIRGYYPALPLTPIALPLVCDQIMYYWHSVVLYALIIKLIVVRAMGAKAYDEILQPFAVGLLGGEGLNYFLSHLYLIATATY